MNIDWAAFTPYSALIGGALIGLAAAMMIVGIGRVAGVSGVVGALFTDDSKESWRWYFVLGLLAAPWLYQLFNVLPEINIETPSLMLIVAGLLVGIGTRYG
nr:YeeE/YedE family protein [Agitococcus sp.]